MKAILVGATGQMGRAISCLAELEGVEVVAEVGLGAAYESISDVNVAADIIIDFSSPTITEEILSYSRNNSIPVFMGTTGHTDEQKEKIEKLGEEVAVCLASNTSVGINLLFDQVANIAKKLPDWDVEIFEKHHNKKKDSPSGTALSLAHSIIQERPELEIVTDRTNNDFARKENELGVCAIRAGGM